MLVASLVASTAVGQTPADAGADGGTALGRPKMLEAPAAWKRVDVREGEPSVPVRTHPCPSSFKVPPLETQSKGSPASPTGGPEYSKQTPLG